MRPLRPRVLLRQEGEVDKIVTGAGDTTFLCDPAGNRLIRRTPDTTTLYLNGQELTLDRDTGSLSARLYYTHAGKTVAVRTGGKLAWLADHQGTAQVAVDAESMTVTKRRQTPFGQARGVTANPPGEKGFVCVVPTTPPLVSSTSVRVSTTPPWAASSPSTPP